MIYDLEPKRLDLKFETGATSTHGALSADHARAIAQWEWMRTGVKVTEARYNGRSIRLPEQTAPKRKAARRRPAR